MSSVFNPNEQVSNLDAKLIYSLERVSQIYRTLLWQTQVQTGLSPIQSQILIFMFEHDEKLLSISSFALEFSVSKATISDAFKTLEKKGLVRKEKDILDKRRQILKLTNDGIELAQQINEFTQPLEEVLTGLPTQQKTTLFSGLTEILHGLNKKNLLTSLRMCHNCHYFASKDGKSYCNLMESVLRDEDLRVDCPEFESNIKK